MYFFPLYSFFLFLVNIIIMLEECITKGNQFHVRYVVKVIPQQSKEVSFRSEDPSFCDTYEVHYYFFKDTPKMKTANIVFHPKEHCQNKTMSCPAVFCFHSLSQSANPP